MVEVDLSGWDIQQSVVAGSWEPSDEEVVAKAVAAALNALRDVDSDLSDSVGRGGEISIALADDATIRTLNHDYRDKDKPTNVLSFPNEDPPMPGMPRLLGDVVLSCETCRREAEAVGRSFADHLSHLSVHGVLHLFGYDHMDPEEASEMEAMEIRILDGMGISDPYADSELVE